MAQHFLLSAAARSLSAAKIMRMSDCGVDNVFLRLRWPETDGKPTARLRLNNLLCLPTIVRPPAMALKGLPPGPLDHLPHPAVHKLPPRTYLLAVAAFCNEVKGHSMLAFARDLDVQYKAALCGRS